MERLTKRCDRGDGVIETIHFGHRYGKAFFPVKGDYDEYVMMLERLAAYEDTGLEPEEVATVQETLLTVQRLKKEQFAELEKFLKAQAEGRIVQIPPEKEIYWIGNEDFTDELVIESGLFCYTDGRTYHVKTVWGGRLFDVRKAGRDFFLTMKEAEAELERRKHE